MRAQSLLRAFAAAAALSFAAPAAAQTDSTRTGTPADTTQRPLLITEDPSEAGAAETTKARWPALAAIGAILITSYLLYNVRSR